jgi:spoIIIJ-associated protein
MKKIEARTLEEAYAKAAETFDCSVTDLEYEIVQHPSRGFLGFGSKKAIVVAACHSKVPSPSVDTKSKNTHDAPINTMQEEIPSAPEHQNTSTTPREQKSAPDAATSSVQTVPAEHSSETEILNGFFDNASPSSANETSSPARHTKPKQAYSDSDLGPQIEKELERLIRSTCFEIDTVEVDVIDGTAYIFIDGEDAALLIGKEGYRYNALSYLLYNWLHNEYGLFIKLEIAQFLASQQEMIRNYIQPVIEHVRQKGLGKTRPLDGILVQIALEQLREEFPNKYVAIKRTRNGERYILVNEFNKRS